MDHSAWDILTRAGFKFQVDGERLLVRPAEGLTDGTRKFIKEKKSEIMDTVQAINKTKRLIDEWNAQTLEKS